MSKPTKPADAHPSSIAETPQFKDAANQAKVAAALVKWGPRLRPLLRLFRVDIAELDKSISALRASLPNVERFLTIPDRFNALYAQRGWIATSIMSMDVMIAAVELGESGDTDGGEQVLVDQFTEDHLSWHLMRLGSLKNFRDRQELARLTMIDFLEGRYHACVPNLLMLVDGLASDASGNSDSFFSKTTDLTAWNLIEGHPSGLPALSRLMQLPRMKRRTESLSIPYRHGILHGRDLGFGNKLVAAKCWAMLIAVGEWARAAENGQRNAPPPTPQPSLLESVRQLNETLQRSERMRNWRPRVITPGVTIPATGPADAYQSGSAEHAMSRYLDLWHQRNFGEMAKLVAAGPNKIDPRSRARDINQLYRIRKLTTYTFTEIVERSPTAMHFVVSCAFDDGRATSFGFNVVNEDENGEYFRHDDPSLGTWRIENWAVVAGESPRL